jgi:hypothetical protein
MAMHIVLVMQKHKLLMVLMKEGQYYMVIVSTCASASYMTKQQTCLVQNGTNDRL